jgi:hypothetical protein
MCLLIDVALCEYSLPASSPSQLGACPLPALATPQIFHPLSLLVLQPSERIQQKLESFQYMHDWETAHIISLQASTARAVSMARNCNEGNVGQCTQASCIILWLHIWMLRVRAVLM